MKLDWKKLLICLAIPLGVGGLSALISGGMSAYQVMNQPPLSPPGWVFPVVWTLLYGLMGLSAANIYAASPTPARSRGLNLFISQLITNFFWSPIFFNARAYGFALAWLLLLWVLVLLMILEFRKADKTAAKLQIPYLLWLTFAAYLNYGVWQLNR